MRGGKRREEERLIKTDGVEELCVMHTYYLDLSFPPPSFPRYIGM